MVEKIKKIHSIQNSIDTGKFKKLCETQMRSNNAGVEGCLPFDKFLDSVWSSSEFLFGSPSAHVCRRFFVFELMQNYHGLYLDEAVLEPRFSAIDKAYGMNGYEYLANNVESVLFNQSMSDHTMVVMRKIIDKYNWFNCLKVVVDVGGGVETNINTIVSKYHIIKGINFELPHAVEAPPSFPGMLTTMKNVGPTFIHGLVDITSTDIVLNTWGDEQCLKLLKNCYEALPRNGKVIVVEKILSTIPEPNNATRITYASDLSMMVFSPKSKERTETEFQELAKGSGFVGIRLACNACNFWVIEFLK
ncbi:hypothetical protein Syun_001464 [Stephania yunnanensis]|uniref:O-methyltransferase C-terminal domain-containing protein n=1 Tax=Stephania yunnanensis TaxID=152371 RepID=A0AAP0LJG7_9MAGN